MLISRHTVVLSGEGAPEWVHLLPAGTFKGQDGRGPYTLKDADAVIASSMKPGKFPLDENHATDHAVDTGQPSPARGWVMEMQARDDGLWGRVEWTGSGTALMNDKAYAGLSPVFEHAADGTVLRVLRAALTNTPNLTLTSLNSRENPVDLAALRAALGLPETADEAACLAAVTANRQAIALHTAQIAAITSAAGLAAGLAPDAIVTALQTQRQTASSTETMAATITSLQTQLATIQAATAKDKAVAFVDGAIKAGKPINPTRDYWIARHQQAPAETEAAINGLPSITGTQVVTHTANPEGGGEQPTPEQTKVAQMMGLDPKKLAKHARERELQGSTV